MASGSAFSTPWETRPFGAGLGRLAEVVDNIEVCRTKHLVVGRDFDFLTSRTSGDRMYGKKRSSSLENCTTVRPSELEEEGCF